jgi:hypothetical protein
MSILDDLLLKYDIFEGRIRIPIADLKRRRFNLIDRIQDKARQENFHPYPVIPEIKL